MHTRPGVFPKTLCQGMAYLLRYNDTSDSECVTLMETIKINGVENTLAEYTGLPSDHPITKRVKDIYVRISKKTANINIT